MIILKILGLVFWLLVIPVGLGLLFRKAPKREQLPEKLQTTGVTLLIGYLLLFALLEIVGIPVLPFAIGVYLPVQLNACIMVGGLVRLAFDKMKKEEKEKEAIISDGILYCSGMIAGEGLVGILLALLAVFGLDQAINLSSVLNLPAGVANVASILVFALVILSVLKFSLWKKRERK